MYRSKMISTLVTMLMLFVTADIYAKHKKSHSVAQPKASVVIDANTGEIISGQNQRASRYPASLTKMMTMYLLFEAMDQGNVSLDDQLKVSKFAYNKFGADLNLKPGDTITVRNALLALAVKSANNVAVVVAESLAGTEAAFAEKMTQKAHQIGMKNTVFKNASGWFHKDHKTTAYDMAILLKTIHAKYPQYYKYLGAKTFSFNGKTYKNRNKLLGKYPGVDGGKTGYVARSGYCLALSAAYAKGRVVAVVLGEPTREQRTKGMTKLLDKSLQK